MKRLIRAFFIYSSIKTFAIWIVNVITPVVYGSILITTFFCSETMTMPDFYEMLNVPRNASLENIRTAYKEKARQLHPDKDRSEGKENLEKMQELNNARDVLCDPTKRQQYDAQLDAISAHSTTSHPHRHHPYSRPAQTSSSYTQPFYSNSSQSQSFQNDSYQRGLMEILRQKHATSLELLLQNDFPLPEVLQFHNVKTPYFADRLDKKDRLYVLLRRSEEVVSFINACPDKGNVRYRLFKMSKANLLAILRNKAVIIKLLTLGFLTETVDSSEKNILLWKNSERFNFLVNFSAEWKKQWFEQFYRLYYWGKYHEAMKDPSVSFSLEYLTQARKESQLQTYVKAIEEVLSRDVPPVMKQDPMLHLPVLENKNYHKLLFSHYLFAVKSNHPHPLKALVGYIPLYTLLQVQDPDTITALLTHINAFQRLDEAIRKPICDNVISINSQQLEKVLIAQNIASMPSPVLPPRPVLSHYGLRPLQNNFSAQTIDQSSVKDDVVRQSPPRPS
jgi:hypothetical protein